MKYEPRLHVVLHQPEIPHNTGAVGRTCVAAGAKLWLVRPLGFRIDDYYLRRAGLDYWEHLEWEAVDDWPALAQSGAILALNEVGGDPTRLFVLTGLDKVRFRRRVIPGDQLRMEVKILKFHRPLWRMQAVAKVGDELACEAELSAMEVEEQVR